MKKLLAILLVFLMPLCAMAETYGLSINVETDGEAFLTLVTDTLTAQPDVDADTAAKTAELMQKLLDGLGMDVSFQEAAYAMTLRLGGKTLLDMTGYETVDSTLLTSSLIPGYALSSPVEENEVSGFEEIDWAGVGLSMISALDAWCAGLEKTETRGIFVGDAFEGGTKCTTWFLDDQDLAALMDTLLNEDVRAALTIFYTAAELDADDILTSFDELNDSVAQENRYAYTLRVVRDAADQLVGMSLTVAQDGEQAATASLGFLPEGVKVVIGLGLDKQNYWCEATTNYTAQEDKVSMSTTIREWAALKEDAFAYVQGATAPANISVWQLDIAANGCAYAWNCAVTANGDVLLTATGTCVPSETSLEGVVSLGDEENKLLSISFAFGQTDDIPALDETLTVCSLTDEEDAELAEELSNQLLAALMARLIKLLPMEQILQMNEFTLP